MDAHLPMFPPFDPELDKADVAVRWRKWQSRLENLFVAMKIQDDKRKRALLLHYAGEHVHDIFDAERSVYTTSASTTSTSTTTVTSSSSTSGTTQSPDCATSACTKTILNTYFAPKRNVQMEIYIFRSCKQIPDQTLEAYVTELHHLALTCSFPDTEKEILSQVIQHCSSQRLRRRALREPDKSLSEIAAVGRMLEQADMQAQAMEKSEVNALPRKPPPPQAQPYHNQGYSKFRNRSSATSQAHKGTRSAPSATCGNCGGHYPHDGQCPAAGKTCNLCRKPNHFAQFVALVFVAIVVDTTPMMVNARQQGKRVNPVTNQIILSLKSKS